MSTAGYGGTILDVNLDGPKTRRRTVDEGTLRLYIGGAGLACRLLFDEQEGGLDALSPEALIVFATGPLTEAVVPGGGSLVLCAKSPLTGAWGEARLGTDAGFALRRGGCDALIVRGRAERWSVLVVDDGNVDLLDGRDLAGLTTSEKEGRLAQRLGRDFEILSIGPAGENLVPFAAVMKGHRAAGRCGMGALLGSKKILALALRGRGRGRVERADETAWQSAVREAHARIRAHATSAEFTRHGTMGGMAYSDASGDFPSRNWLSNSSGKGQQIFDSYYDRNFRKAVGCYRGCPLRCGRKVLVPDGPLATPLHDGGEYESVSAFTAFVDGTDVDAAVHASWLCNEYGLDTISCGAVIAFAMECREKGLLADSRVDGLDLSWGNGAVLAPLVGQIARREGLGELLALGVREAAERLGPEAREAAVHVKGLEGPAHDPRSGKLLALTYGTNNRGMCHIHPIEAKAFDCDKQSFGLTAYGLPDPETIHPWDETGKGLIAARLQDYGTLFEMFATCKFYGYCGLELSHYAEMIGAATGWAVTGEELLEAGERVNTLQRLFNLREGLTADDDRLPDRVRQVPSFGRYAGEERCAIADYEGMLADYYEARGWDAKGVPTEATRRRLGLL